MSSTPSTPSLIAALRGGSLLVVLVLAIGVLATLCSLGANAYVEIMWHAQVGYGSVFWKRVLWEWGARIGVGIGVPKSESGCGDTNGDPDQASFR